MTKPKTKTRNAVCQSSYHKEVGNVHFQHVFVLIDLAAESVQAILGKRRGFGGKAGDICDADICHIDSAHVVQKIHWHIRQSLTL